MDILALSNLSTPEVLAMSGILSRFAEIVKRSIQGALRPGATYPAHWQPTKGDIFYSDVGLALREFNGYACRHLLYSWMCSMLRRAQIYVHS